MNATPYFLVILLVCFGCDNDPGGNPGPRRGNGTPASADWKIPEDKVFDGGPGKDGIPSIDSPQFEGTDSQDNLYTDDELMVVIRIGTTVRAYPHDILDWHEIVNDKINDVSFSLNYCPLTGTAMAWNRVINGSETTFGVSGLLYNTNLIPYDRRTDSEWSQLLMRGVRGQNADLDAELIPVVETTYGSFKKLWPNGVVMSQETGFNRNYGEYPYGGYRTDNALLYFPVDPYADDLDAKEIVLGVRVNEKVKAYRYNGFENSVQVINDVFEGQEIVVAGSTEENILVAFSRKLADGTILELSPLSSLPAIMVDGEGNVWDVFGECISGDRQGQQLPLLQSLHGFWFAFGAFYPDPEIYQ